MAKEKLGLLPRFAALLGVISTVGTVSSDINLDLLDHCPGGNTSQIAKTAAPLYVSELLEQAQGNFYKVIELMRQCDLIDVNEASGKLAFLKAQGYIQASPFYPRSGPVDVVFVGGKRGDIIDNRSSSFQIVYWWGIMDGSNFKPVDQIIYFMQGLYMLEEIMQTEGNVTEKMTVLKPKIEASAWLSTLGSVIRLKRQIQDPFIISVLEKFEELEPDGFTDYWKLKYEAD